MKILHINTSSEGGAALCAIRISKALEQQGVESKMLFAQGADMPKGIEGAVAEKDRIIQFRSNWLIAKFRHLLMRIPWYWNVEKMQARLKEDNDEGLYVHHPLSEYSNIINHPLVQWADIIHLHWVAEFVDYPTFFKKVKKPIVWTLHDKYPAMGVLHYCSEFYPVPQKLKEIDSLCRKIKRVSVSQTKELNIVSISDMMVKCCNNSDILKGFPVTLIHNGVDVDVFKPYDKTEARKQLGIIADAKVFLFSSYNIHDPNKGLDRLIDAINQINSSNKTLICLGDFQDRVQLNASFPIIQVGLINDQIMIAKYYSAADFLMQCSYEESYGQTLTEAMACGCPVISTPTGVASELIKDFNGVICNGYDVNAITEGIKKALAKKYDAAKIRQYLESEYSYDIIAGKYLKLYNQILKKN